MGDFYFDEKEKEKINPYKNPGYFIGEGLESNEDLIASCLNNDIINEKERYNVRQALALEHYYTRARLMINPNNPFGLALAGRRTHVLRKVLLERAYRKLITGTPEENKKEELNRDGILLVERDFYHFTPEWTILLEKGFVGLRERAGEYRKRKERQGTLSAGTADFYRAVDISFGALLQLIDRFVICLKQLNDKNDNLRYMENALKALRYAPPSNFYEALLFSYLYHLASESGEGIQVRTLGNIDDLFRPYYEKDLREGRLFRESAKQLIKFYFFTFNCQGHWAGQPAGLGGSLANGETAVNDLSFVMLEAYDELDILSPKLQVLTAKNTPDLFIKKCFEMTRHGHSSIVFMNDDLGRQIFSQFASEEEQKTIRVQTGGCYNFRFGDITNEPAPCRINLPKLINLVFDDEEKLNKIITFEDFFNAWLEKFEWAVDQCVMISNFYDSMADRVSPANLLSGTVASALEKGEDVFMAGVKYNNSTINNSCIGTVFDSLAMVKKYVFDKKAVSLWELKKILDSNWENEYLRQIVSADHDKWGNNIEWVDSVAVSLYDNMIRIVTGKKNQRGGHFVVSGDSIDFDTKFMKYVKATPDGRKSGEPLSKNLNASRGQDRNGLTAFLQSIVKLPSSQMWMGAPVDYMIHPSVAEGEEGLAVMTGVLKTFFGRGGYSFMGNIIDAEAMKKAKKDPGSYRNLQIRLCGWNVRFNDLQEVQQDLLIRQAEYGSP